MITCSSGLFSTIAKMFILSTFKDTVRIPPHKFGHCQKDAIMEELNERLANNVIIDVGLCIVAYDILTMGQSFIYHGDPATHTAG